jgi:predicted dehydrogenase
MSKVKVGVIGVGNMGYNHVRVYNELFSDVELVGIFDVDQHRAKEVAEKFSTLSIGSIEELLKHVQAVSIVTPTSMHLEHGLIAAAANVNALIEKPIAASFADGKRLADEFHDRGLLLQIGHIERYNPAVVELKKILETEKILAISFKRLSSDRRIYDTDIVHDLMIHDIDLMNWLINAPTERIHAEGIINILGKNSIDYAESLIKFENGVVASLLSSRITEDKIRTVDVHTDSSYIQVDCVNRSIQISRKTNYRLDIGHDITYRQENIIEKVIVPQYEPLKVELLDFVRSVKAGSKSPVSGFEGLEAVRIADEISALIK